MKVDGYTLVEMLVALTVVGMTAAGLAEAGRALARVQREASRSLASERSMALIQTRFDDFMRGRGPFRSDDKPQRFEGSAHALEFACGQQTCTAELLRRKAGMALDLGLEDGTHVRLPMLGVADASFAYGDQKAEHSDWPPSDQGLRLRSVAILGGFEPDRRPLALTSLHNDQAPDCEFDPIIKSCRTSSDGPG